MKLQQTDYLHGDNVFKVICQDGTRQKCFKEQIKRLCCKPGNGFMINDSLRSVSSDVYTFVFEEAKG